jgi:hypothetical protein
VEWSILMEYLQYSDTENTPCKMSKDSYNDEMDKKELSILS